MFHFEVSITYIYLKILKYHTWSCCDYFLLSLTFHLFSSFVLVLAMLHSGGIWVPWPGIEPVPLEVVWSLNHWTTREVPPC